MATTKLAEVGGRALWQWRRALWLLASLSLLAGLAALAIRTPLPAGACRLTFADDFAGAGVDTRRWNTTYPSGRTELQYYSPEALDVSNGRLRITARPQPQHGRAYTSGVLTTQGRFTQQYGYFEIRARVPAGRGLWPAFWLLHAGSKPWNEIDIFEILGHQPDKVYLSSHWPDAALHLQSASHHFIGPDFSAGYHTFAVDWEPGRLVWYVDGLARATASEHVPDEPMFILANLAVGGQWPGSPDAATQFPAYLDIDYIRVYAPGCPGPGSVTPTAPAF